MDLTSRAKQAVRDHYGIWPAFELRNRILTARSTFANKRLEDAEVMRLQSPGVPRPEVLVVMPTYKRPDQLRLAVESALQQTHGDFYIVVVADGEGLEGAPDDDRVLKVSLERNTATLGLVRNVGIRLADSDFIAFLDDDNTWEPRHLELLVDALKASPDALGAYSTARRIHPDGSLYDELGEPFDRDRLRNDAYIDINTVIVRRSERARFSVLPRSRKTLPKEDWEFIWRLSRSGPFIHVPNATVNYTVNPESYYTNWDPPAPVS